MADTLDEQTNLISARILATRGRLPQNFVANIVRYLSSGLPSEDAWDILCHLDPRLDRMPLSHTKALLKPYTIHFPNHVLPFIRAVARKGEVYQRLGALSTVGNSPETFEHCLAVAEELGGDKGIASMGQYAAAHALLCALHDPQYSQQDGPRLLKRLLSIPGSQDWRMRVFAKEPPMDWMTLCAKVWAKGDKVTERLETALDLLQSAGVEMNVGNPNVSCRALEVIVQSIDGRHHLVEFEQKSLYAFLDRGAQWEGIELSPKVKHWIEQHPAVRRERLADLAHPGEHNSVSPRPSM